MNWRLTADPTIDDGILDLPFWFDIGPDQSYCSLPQVTSDYNFLNDPNRYFQLIITDRLVNCALEAAERQNLLHYTLSSKYMISHFGSHTFKINALLLSGAYPIIA